MASHLARANWTNQFQLSSRSVALVAIETSLYAFIALTALLGNLLVLWIVYKNRTLRTIPNYFVISLSCADVVMATVATPWSIAVLAVGDWPFDFTSCQFQGFIVIWAAIASLTNLAVMAVNRFYRIVKPVAYRKFFTTRQTRLYIAAAYLYSLIAPLPYLLEGHIYVFQPGKYFCYQDASVEHTVTLMGIFICLPTLVVTVCYLRVFFALRAHRKNMKKQSGQRNISVEDIKVTKTLFATVAAFLICWSPVFVIEFIDVALGNGSLPRQVYFMFTTCGLCSSAVNPIIYGAMNRTFRKEYKNTLGCYHGNTIHILPANSRSQTDHSTAATQYNN